MTILTIEVNCTGQPDNCYVIFDGAWIVPTVGNVVS